MAAEATDEAASTEVEMAAEVAAPEPAAAAQPAPVAAEGSAPATETGKPADAAPVPPPFDWKPIAGDDADALKLLGDYKTPADLIAEVKKAKADWRDEFSQGDEKTKAWLGRFTDKPSFMKSVNSMRSKMGDKALVKVPDAKSTPEEWSEWRAALGIPETPAGYKINLPKDADQSDIAKAVRENFVAVMHKAGATQAQIDAAIAADMAREEMVEKYLTDQVRKVKQESDDYLRGKWNPVEYRANTEAAKRFLNEEAEALGGEDFLQMELKSGARIGDYPPFIEWAAQQGLHRWGSGAFESGEAMTGADVEAKWQEMMKLVGTDEYGKDHIQKEVKRLNALRNRLNGRAA